LHVGRSQRCSVRDAQVLRRNRLRRGESSDFGLRTHLARGALPSAPRVFFSSDPSRILLESNP
jgi:hypothetical protein